MVDEIYNLLLSKFRIRPPIVPRLPVCGSSKSQWVMYRQTATRRFSWKSLKNSERFVKEIATFFDSEWIFIRSTSWVATFCLCMRLLYCSAFWKSLPCSLQKYKHISDWTAVKACVNGLLQRANIQLIYRWPESTWKRRVPILPTDCVAESSRSKASRPSRLLWRLRQYPWTMQLLSRSIACRLTKAFNDLGPFWWR